MRAFFNYYFTVNLFNLIATVLFTMVASLYWLPILFCTFGLAAGLFAFEFFYKNQYYFYHNLGFTRKKLAVMTFSINAVIALFAFIIILLLS